MEKRKRLYNTGHPIRDDPSRYMMLRILCGV